MKKIGIGCLAVLGIIFVIGLIGTAAGGSKSSNSTQQATTSGATATPEPAIQITASKLYSAYEENAIKADEMYKGKILEVSGISGNISKDIADTMYVTLKTDNFLGSIQCMLPKEEKDKAMALKPDQRITVRGKNSGKLVNIILKDCSIISE